MIYGLTFPIGCILAYKACPSLAKFPFFVCLPIYIGFGFISLIPVYLLGVIVSVNLLIPLVVLGISIIMLLSERKILRNRLETGIRVVFSPENILPLFLFIGTILYFVLSVDYLRWPPAGDVMKTHGPLVSLIEFYGKLPIAPGSIIIAYPPGFHGFVATVNTLLGVYPGEAVLIVAASVIALIPPMVYSATFLATNSKHLSFVAFLSTFIVYPSWHLQKWIVGYFYNGPYPNLTGYLIIFTFVIAVIALSLDFQARTWPMIKKFFLLLILTILSLLVTYPNFAIILSLFAILAMAILHSSIKNELVLAVGRFLRLNLAKKLLSLVIFVSILSVIFFALVNLHLLEIASGYLTSGPIPENIANAYAISMSDFFDSISGIASVIAFPCAIYLFLKKKHLWLDLFYLLLFILLLLSVDGTLLRYVWIIMPNRSIVIAYVLSWIILAVTAYDVERHAIKSARRIYISVRNRRFLVSTCLYQVTITLLVILLFVPSISGYVSFDLTKKLGWFQHADNFQTDFESLEWINKNVPSDALIMNDGSYVSRYAESLSLKNMTNWIWAESAFPERASDLFAIWNDPRNEPYITGMLKKYNVSYIFSTSERIYIGRDILWVSRPYDPEIYAKIFDEYPFLEAVYKSGSTRIYKVVHINLEFEQLLHDIQAANIYWNDVGAWGNRTIGTPILSNTTQRIDIPSGNFSVWGIYHYFDNTTNWSDAQFISISIGASAPRGLSFLVWDTNGNYNRYDFVCGGDNRTTVFITLGSPSESSQGNVDMTALRRIGLLAGYIGPLTQPKDSLFIWEITLYRYR